MIAYIKHVRMIEWPMLIPYRVITKLQMTDMNCNDDGELIIKRC